MLTEFFLFQDEQGKFEKSASPASDGGGGGGGKARSNASNSGSESPKPARKRFGSIADDLDVARFNGEAAGAAAASGGATNEQLEAMKQEILREMKKEMAKMKSEIIEGMVQFVLSSYVGRLDVIFWATSK
jgi:hypothetical protein